MSVYSKLKIAEKALGLAGITVNKNKIPFDPETPFVTSGMRIGTPAITTRGMAENEMKQIAAFIDEAINYHQDEQRLKSVHGRVTEMSRAFPLYADLMSVT